MVSAVSVRLDQDVVIQRLVALETRATCRLGAHEAVVTHEHEHRSIDERHDEAVLCFNTVVDGAQAAVEVRADVLAVAGAHRQLAVAQVLELEQALRRPDTHSSQRQLPTASGYATF